MLILLLVEIVNGGVGYLIGRWKRRPIYGLVLGLILSVLGWVIVLIDSPKTMPGEIGPSRVNRFLRNATIFCILFVFIGHFIVKGITSEIRSDADQKYLHTIAQQFHDCQSALSGSDRAALSTAVATFHQQVQSDPIMNVDDDVIAFGKDSVAMMDDWNIAAQKGDATQVESLSVKQKALAQRANELEQKYGKH